MKILAKQRLLIADALTYYMKESLLDLANSSALKQNLFIDNSGKKITFGEILSTIAKENQPFKAKYISKEIAPNLVCFLELSTKYSNWGDKKLSVNMRYGTEYVDFKLQPDEASPEYKDYLKAARECEKQFKAAFKSLKNEVAAFNKSNIEPIKIKVSGNSSFLSRKDSCTGAVFISLTVIPT